MAKTSSLQTISGHVYHITFIIFKQHSTLLSLQEAKCGFVIILMALYWCTECVPLAVTALLPVILFPMMGILESSEVFLILYCLQVFDPLGTSVSRKCDVKNWILCLLEVIDYNFVQLSKIFHVCNTFYLFLSRCAFST